MALAVGALKGVSAPQLAGMDQQDAEALAAPMDLLGLLVLSNRLHRGSRATVTSLQDK